MYEGTMKFQDLSHGEYKTLICPVCGAEFKATASHYWIAHVYSTSVKDPVCSYTCMRKIEKKEQAEREEQWRKAEERKRQREEERYLKRLEERERIKAEARDNRMTAAELKSEIENAVRKQHEFEAQKVTPEYAKFSSEERHIVIKRLYYWRKRKEKLEKEFERRFGGKKDEGNHIQG